MLSGMSVKRAVTAGGAVVQLSGEAFINDFDPSPISPWDTRSGIRINTDGTIDKYLFNGSGYTQIDALTDWIIPNASASSSYQVRLDVTSGTPNYVSAATSTWLAMSTNRQWIVRRTTVGNTSWNWTLRIRLDTGAEIDNAIYSGNATASL
jgi:hypothetical protein